MIKVFSQSLKKNQTNIEWNFKFMSGLYPFNVMKKNEKRPKDKPI